MKTIFIALLAVFLGLMACNTPEKAGKTEKTPKIAETDSTEYKLLVFDAGFETWFTQNRKPAWYHEKSYYKNHNTRYVTEWNNKVRRGAPGFDQEINYDPSVDYGLEIEHKLYYFFRYVGFD